MNGIVIMKASAKDLRFNSKKLLEIVDRGEEVVITYRGKPCAKLVPLDDKKNKTTGNPLFGIWKDDDRTVDVAGYVRNLRKARFE